jgi:hypothetical protein
MGMTCSSRGREECLHDFLQNALRKEILGRTKHREQDNIKIDIVVCYVSRHGVWIGNKLCLALINSNYEYL